METWTKTCGLPLLFLVLSHTDVAPVLLLESGESDQGHARQTNHDAHQRKGAALGALKLAEAAEADQESQDAGQAADDRKRH